MNNEEIKAQQPHISPADANTVLQAVLSLFDGMSCGRIALERAGYEVIQYFASEIKPHAIRCTQSNYPNTIQLGSVLNVKGSDLPKIDLLIGGSPCKGISRLNKNQEGLEHSESKLFWFYRDWETDRKSVV